MWAWCINYIHVVADACARAYVTARLYVFMEHSVDNDKESSPNQQKAEEKSGKEDGTSSAKRAHPLYKQLSLMSGEVNLYTLEELRARLRALKLNDRYTLWDVLSLLMSGSRVR